MNINADPAMTEFTIQAETRPGTSAVVLKLLKRLVALLKRQHSGWGARFEETYAEEGTMRGPAAIILMLLESVDAISACRVARTEAERLWREAIADEELPLPRWHARPKK
jgi:hypothetical protein